VSAAAGPAGAFRGADPAAAARRREERELLLRAALVPGPEGLAAWRAWRARTSLDALDRDSGWLLPLLYDALHRQGVAPALLARYRNVYLHTWYRNHLLLARARPALARLARPGAAPVLVGGAAMALGYHAGLAVRPLEALTVLLPGQADPRLGGSGGAIAVRPSLFGPAVDADLARQARPVRWSTLRLLALDPAALLVDACVHRESWDRRSALLWVADAVCLLRRVPDLPRDRVAALAARLGRAGEVAALVRDLQARFGLAGPEALRRAPGPAPAPPGAPPRGPGPA
jgi:hypothetical protein